MEQSEDIDEGPRAGEVLLMVENLDTKINNQQLRDVFEGATRAKTVWRSGKYLGFAGVYFSSQDDALQAIRQHNRRKLGNKEIRLRIGTPGDLRWFEKPSNKKKKAAKPEERDLDPEVLLLKQSMSEGSASYPSHPIASSAPSSSSSFSSHQPHPSSLHTLSDSAAYHPSPQTATSLSVPSSSTAAQSAALLAFDGTVRPFMFPPLQELLSLPLLFIHFETATSSMGTHVLPCEIGISVFTLTQRELFAYHKLIDPGPVERSYLSDALWQTQHTHTIPFHGFELASKDYHRIWNEITQFVRRVSPTGPRAPPMWAKGPYTASKCLSWLAKHAGTENPFSEVRELEELVYYILQSSGRQPQNVMTTVIEAFGPENAYQPGRCDFHKQRDASTGQVTGRCAYAEARVLGEIICKLASQVGIVSR